MHKLSKYIYLLFFIALGLTPLLWFRNKSGFLINGVDTNFPLDPWMWFQRRLYVWNSINGGTDFSSSTAGLFFHLIQVIPYKIGFSLQGVQIISFLFWFSLIVFAAFALSSVIFPKSRLAQFIFTLLYSFNIYAFNAWENVKVANISLIAAIPLGAVVLSLLKKKKISYSRAFFLSTLVGIVASGTGINPSYFIALYFALFLFALGSIIMDFTNRNILRDIKSLFIVVLSIFLINSFWIIPTAHYILRDIDTRNSIQSIGFTNWLDSLSENTSLVNVMRLQGAWDWYATDLTTGLPLYIPYALNFFYRLPFIAFSFLLPTLAFSSFLFTKKNKASLYISFAIMLVVGIFLGSGTHSPTGVLFEWLAKNVPFFSLFRSPWYIFTPILVFAYAGLIALLVFNLNKRFRKLTFLGVAVLTVGNLLYCYPLVTGKIFRPTRQDTFYVKFPDYVFESQQFLQQKSKSRIIGYPDDEIEQFSWGYRGIESVLTLLSDREVMFSPLNMPNSPSASLIRQFYTNLKKGEVNSALRVASKLNIDMLFEKKDQSSLSAQLPQAIIEMPYKQIGKWNFYSINSQAPTKVHTSTKFVYAYPFAKGSELMTALDPAVALVNPIDSVVKSSPLIASTAGYIILAENSQEKALGEYLGKEPDMAQKLIPKNVDLVEFTFEIPAEGEYQPKLEAYRLIDYGINPDEALDITIDGREEQWLPETKEDYITYKKISLNKGTHKVSLKLDNKNLFPLGDFQNENVFQKRGDGVFETKEENGNKYLSLINKAEKDTSAYYSFPDFDPNTNYLINIKYRHIYGNKPNLLVGQSNKNTVIKTDVVKMPMFPGWVSFSFYYIPVNTKSEMGVALQSPSTKDPLGTTIHYDDLSAYRVFTNKLIFSKDPQVEGIPTAEVRYDKISPAEYKGEVTALGSGHAILFAENYSPNWDIRLYDSSGKPIDARALHFSSNLYENSWYIEGAPQTYKFKIFYKPQRLFLVGIFISIVTFIIGIIVTFRGRTGRFR